VDDQGNLLPSNTVDPHYTLVAAPYVRSAVLAAYTLIGGLPVPPWTSEGPTSRWIAPEANQGLGSPPGDYVYRTSFDLKGFHPGKVTIVGGWDSDNAGTDILLNGISLGIWQVGIGGFSDFAIHSGFIPGTNVLDFVVNNFGTNINPTGLRVELHGTVELTNEPPSIANAQFSSTAIVGDEVTFSVIAYGTPPLSYQWCVNGTNIPGATFPTNTVTAVTAAHAGTYTVVLKNPLGVCTGAVAKLIVLDPIPGLYNTGVKDDGTVLNDLEIDPHYSVELNPDGPSRNAIVADSTSVAFGAGLWLGNNATSKWIGPTARTTGASDGNYVYRFSFDLIDMDPTTAFLMGRWTSDNQGISILLNGASTGLSQPGHIWTLNSFIITNGFVSGSNSLDFVVKNYLPDHTGLRVDHLRGGAKKESGLTSRSPRVVVQPKGAILISGDSATLSVVADGAKPLWYRWTFDGKNLAGETNSSLVRSNVVAAQAGAYVVLVSNSMAETSSAVARVTVLAKVPGLFNTGVAQDGGIMGEDAIDPHYQLIVNAEGALSLNAAVQDRTEFAVAAKEWSLTNSLSKWIGPHLNFNAAPGEYVYRTTFDLTGFDPATALLEGDWAADDEGHEILFNGESTGLHHFPQLFTWTHFVITNGFSAGTNTLDFVILNGFPIASPTGLRVENLRVGANRRLRASESLGQ
jgi:hypothetical protein